MTRRLISFILILLSLLAIGVGLLCSTQRIGERGKLVMFGPRHAWTRAEKIHIMWEKYYVAESIQRAVIQVESGGRSVALGYNPALQSVDVGLVQVSMLHYAQHCRDYGDFNPFDPIASISFMARYLAHLRDVTGGMDNALAAYNQGWPIRDAERANRYVSIIHSYWRN